MRLKLAPLIIRLSFFPNPSAASLELLYSFRCNCNNLIRRMSTSTGANNGNVGVGSDNNNPYRLPTTITPKHYDLTFQFPKTFKSKVFSCSEVIHVKINEDTNQIKLNACKNFQYDQIEFKSTTDDAASFSPIETIVEANDETLTLKFAETFKQGSAGQLHLKFSGQINDSLSGGLKGLFRTKCRTGAAENSGDEHYNYLTFFCPVAARYCFPCWDEPQLKATFGLRLIFPQSLVGIANMPVESEEPFDDQDPSLKTLKFQPTPLMSTYLLAFVIGEFEYIEKLADGILCRVYAPTGKAESGKFALEVAIKALNFYKSYFGIDYPLPKLDLVAITDFPCGGMENWGIISFCESVLLVDPIKSSTFTKQRVALVVAHEVAHMWFGDLVTMNWWGQIWLNEAFATFMQYLCVSHLYPEFDVWSQFTSDVLQIALDLDSLASSHPVEVQVQNPSEIDEIFDVISYKKGASIILMLYDYIGDKDFRVGMKNYLSKYMYGNSSTAQLWEALEESAVGGKPIATMMSTWTEQMGYPLLTVEEEVKSQDQASNERVISVRQEIASASASSKIATAIAKGSSSSKSKWLVPLQFSQESSPSSICHSAIFDGTKSDTLIITIPNVGPEEWVKLNREKSFYRVKYSEMMLAKLIAPIKSKAIDPLGRLSVLDDIFAFVRNGKETTDKALKLLTEAFVDEGHYTVWVTICDFLNKLDQLFFGTEHEEAFRKYGLALLDGIGKKVGWEAQPGETHLETLLRPLILAQLVKFEHPPTLAEGRARFNLHVEETVRVYESGEGPQAMVLKYILPADLRQLIYTSALMQANDEIVMNCALEHSRGADLLEEKLRILRAVSAMPNVELLQQYLQYAITNPAVTSSDLADILISVSKAKIGRRLVWNFFKQHSKLFQDRFQGGMTLCSLIKNICTNFTEREAVADIQQFFATHEFRGVERVIAQALESIQLNADWLARDEECLKLYFLSAGADASVTCNV